MTAGEELARAAGAFGRHLRHERELREISRAEVVRRTRLSGALVEALESGDAARMPPKAYVFGYLRAYAAAVGLDADDVVLRWQEVVGPEVERAPLRARVPVVRAAVVLLVLLAVAAVVLLTLFGPHERRTAVVKGGASTAERVPMSPSAEDRP